MFNFDTVGQTYTDQFLNDLILDIPTYNYPQNYGSSLEFIVI